MNRKLHHTVMALSATATVFTLMLIAAGPARSPVPVSTVIMSGMAQPAVLEPTVLMVAADTQGASLDAQSVESPVASALQRRHLRHSRAILALPYFSFAQGLRRNRS